MERRCGLVVSLVTLILVLSASASSASTGRDGPTPTPSVGDPVSGNVSPHAGYGTGTNFCLQCHGVHGGGAYALMWKASVTDTCNTCHGLYGWSGSTTPTGTRTPSGGGLVGTVATRTAYDLRAPGASHQIGKASIPDEGSAYLTQAEWDHGVPTVSSTTRSGPGTADVTTDPSAGGLYCGSCHTPHGPSFGAAVNSRWVVISGSPIATPVPTVSALPTSYTEVWANNAVVYYTAPTMAPYSTVGTGWRVLFQSPSPSPLATPPFLGVWNVCTDTTHTVCAPAVIADSEGQLVSLWAYKLLSVSPNHSYSRVQSFKADRDTRDAAGWCAACHTTKLDTSHANVNNHPAGCGCHGNPSDGGSYDFPHTSSKGDFLIATGDALCRTCHTSLP